MKRWICLVLSAMVCLGAVPLASVADASGEDIQARISELAAIPTMYNDCDATTVDGVTLVTYCNATAMTMELETNNVTQGSACVKVVKKSSDDDDLPVLFRTTETLELSDYTAISFDIYVSENMKVLGTDSAAWAKLRFQTDHVDNMDTGGIFRINFPEKIPTLRSGEWVTVTLDIPEGNTGTFRQISIRPGDLCFEGVAGDYLLIDNVRLTRSKKGNKNWILGSGFESEVISLKEQYDLLSDAEKTAVTDGDLLVAWAEAVTATTSPAVKTLNQEIDAVASQCTDTPFNLCEEKEQAEAVMIANINNSALGLAMETDNVSEGSAAAKYIKLYNEDCDIPMIVRSNEAFSVEDYSAVRFDLYISENMTVIGTPATAWTSLKLQSAWVHSPDADAICSTSFINDFPLLQAGQWNTVTVKLPAGASGSLFKQIVIRIGQNCLQGDSGEYVILDNVRLVYSESAMGNWAVGSGFEEKIKAMKAEYDALDPIQQQAVSRADLLIAWSQAIEIAETTLAGEVVKMIDAIGTVHVFSGDDIRNARTNYNKLSDAKKAEVTNYQVLVDAEAALEEMLKTGAYVVPEEMRAKPATAGGQTLSTCDDGEQLLVSGSSHVVYPTVDEEKFAAFTVGALAEIQITAPMLASSPVDLKGAQKEDLSLRMLIYISDTTALKGNGQIEISSSGRPDANELNWETGSFVLQNGWNVLYLDLKDGVTTGNEIDLSKINYLRFYLYSAADMILALDDVAIVERVIPEFDEDFSAQESLAKWQSESALSLEDERLKMQGSGKISVSTSAYSLKIAQPFFTPIEFDLLAQTPENVTELTFSLVDGTGKQATIALDPSELAEGEPTRYRVVPFDMTKEPGFTFDLAVTATLTVVNSGENTLYLDNLATNVRSGLYWKDWLYDYTVEPGDFSIAVIPDIQVLTWQYPDKLNTVMQWIADNKEKENIQFAIDVGDVTWHGHDGNTVQFSTAAKAFEILQDAGVEYCISYGNHDIQPGRDTTMLNQYFPLSTMTSFTSYGGVMTEGKIDNMYFCLNIQGIKYMIVSLEYDPTPETIAWANQVIESHPDYNVIVSTHNYMDVVYGQYSYGGENLWPNLVSKHKNIFMLICGHRCIAADPGSMNYRQDIGENGNVVHQIAANAQDIDADRGGVGLLLMMRFTNGGRTIDFNYFSPVNDDLAYKEINQFSITLPEGQLVVDEQAAADYAAAKAVIDQIDTLIGEDAAAIAAARAAYDALTDAQKELVTNLAKLEALENPAPPTPEYAYGDVNSDNAVDAKDALLILQAAVDKITLTEEQIVKADVNGDKAIDAKDALLVLQKAVDKIEKFPVEQ